MKAKLNYIRITPRKLRLVADLVRGKETGEAKTLLKFSKKKGAVPLSKLISSAEAGAENLFGKRSENLRISSLTVDEGPVYKRHMARARGGAAMIRKKTSKITLVLKEQSK